MAAQITNAARITAGVLALTYTTQVAWDAMNFRERELLGLPQPNGFTIGGIAALAWFAQNPGFAEEMGTEWTNVAVVSVLGFLLMQIQWDVTVVMPWANLHSEELTTPP